jgi:MinD-like ATPase involved in chromosome partitioning or flagellar assembly
VKTITFYSYKGGSGRSLTVANAALYLQRLDFKVVVVDFDLEAPGMHYKFSFGRDLKDIRVSKGLVDYIYSFVSKGQIPSSVTDFAVRIDNASTSAALHLIPAGNAPEPEYWQKLSHINWHDLFYLTNGQGVELFFDFKNKIERELIPDFLLIDARTGVTETGGVATSLLADRVICLVSSSPENLDGARAILQSINRTRRGYQIAPAEITVALSRLPEMDKEGNESEVMARVLDVLNEHASSLEDTLGLKEEDTVVLHSERALEVREALRIGSGTPPEDSILLRDYLRLFASIVPKDLVGAKVHSMVSKAREKIWDSPAEALKEVEELAESFGHPDTYRELLRFYRVRNVTGANVLRRAQRLWEISRDPHDEVLWQAVMANFPPEFRVARSQQSFKPRIDFIESVWRCAGKHHLEFGVMLADYCYRERDTARSISVLRELIETGYATEEVVAKCVARLMAREEVKEAGHLIAKFHQEHGTKPSFVRQWARFAIETGNEEYKALLLKEPFADALGKSSPLTYLRLLVAVGRKTDARAIGESMIARPNITEYFQRIPEPYSEIMDAFESVDLGKQVWPLLSDQLVGEDGGRLRRRYERYGRSTADEEPFTLS